MKEKALLRKPQRSRVNEEFDTLWEAKIWDYSIPIQPQKYVKIPLVMLLFIRRVRLLEVMLGISDLTLEGIMPSHSLEKYQTVFDGERQKIIAECRWGHSVDHVDVGLTSDVLQRYIWFRKYRLNQILTKENSELSPVEDEVFEYLSWIKKVLFAIEHNNHDSVVIHPKKPSYEMVAKLAEWHPLIPSTIDFFSALLCERQTAPKQIIDKGKGFKSSTQPRPLIIALKAAIKKLQDSKTAYYNDKHREFSNECAITSSLGNFIQGVQVEKEASSASNRIDLLLKEDEDGIDLAVEAKIIFKNKKIQSNDVKKALFTQVPSYAEVVNRESCAVLYAFEMDIIETFSQIKNIVKKESTKNPKWTLDQSKANDYIHLKLIHEIKDMKKQYDVFIVVLKSKSNTKRHKEK